MRPGAGPRGARTFDEGAGGIASNPFPPIGRDRCGSWSKATGWRGAAARPCGSTGSTISLRSANECPCRGDRRAVHRGGRRWQEASATSGVPTVVSDGNAGGRLLAGIRAALPIVEQPLHRNRRQQATRRMRWGPDQLVPAQAGRWVDLALAHDGTTVRLFVEGRLVSVATGAFQAARQPNCGSAAAT